MDEQLKEEFTAIHEEYTSTISGMAASLECCLFLMRMFRRKQAESILDLGSGISSCAFRLYKKRNNLDTDIWSVDANKGWLQKSKAFSKKHELGSEGFFIWPEIKGANKAFDLIFYDIDVTGHRHKYLETVLSQFVNTGTYLVVDDFHKGVIARRIGTIMSNYNYSHLNIKQYTLDKLGRFCVMYYDIGKGLVE